MSKDLGVVLAGKFNQAVRDLYGDDDVSTSDIIVAAGAMLIAYVAQVPDREWKRKQLDAIWDELFAAWGLGQ